LVPSGAFAQANGGEMFSPTQFGVRCLSLHAFFAASVPLSWICGEVSVKTSPAFAVGGPNNNASPDAASNHKDLSATAFHPVP